mmetsp:Transcript_14988/g.37290  ORF Transcript_14988/g.37290 Transcript_14988/m.37290 type:complete len:223 (-) Transcript_14988:508-1176(-)
MDEGLHALPKSMAERAGPLWVSKVEVAEVYDFGAPRAFTDPILAPICLIEGIGHASKSIWGDVGISTLEALRVLRRIRDDCVVDQFCDATQCPSHFNSDERICSCTFAKPCRHGFRACVGNHQHHNYSVQVRPAHQVVLGHKCWPWLLMPLRYDTQTILWDVGDPCLGVDTEDVEETQRNIVDMLVHCSLEAICGGHIWVPAYLCGQTTLQIMEHVDNFMRF